ncbi:hypothetical protein NDU88_000639 [Pleurodeles waltl]|uniref:C-type lectin domain-containing protein n=1 Tax=Pleurodeles waltl TaxID=8319 RepID=A0AAV7PA95_PLEWA|nr:hypothetical protein NDU88_000639 [Pleurodeles waltl]
MRSLRRFSELMGLVAVSSIIITGLIAWIVVLHTQLSFAQRLLTKCVQSGPAEAGKDGEVPPPCDEDWIWHRNVCYYVSVEEGNWTEAQDFCTVLNSSLAMIDTQKELDFLLRHKGDPDLWIGLRRMGPGQLWIWVDGFKFDNWFTVEDFAECAYLNYGIVKSSECYSKRQWICSKISMYEKE